MSARPQALVIGGGIAGPAAALFLRKAGFDPLVFEARPGPAAGIGAALSVAPNGMAVLDELDLAGRALAAGTAIHRFGFRTRRGHRLGTMACGLPGRTGFPGVSLSRATLHGILADALAQQGIPVTYDRRLAAIAQDATGVVARFADGSQARGAILVGADGINSAVRRLVLPDVPRPAFTGLIGAGGFLPRSVMTHILGAGHTGTMVLCFGDGAFFGAAFGDRQETDGAYWWHALARPQPLSETERRALSGEAGVAALLRAGDGWCPMMRAILAATTTHFDPIDLFDVASLPRWSVGRVVLVGDAAHAVSPHSGQGAAMALEDAIVLARALRSGPDMVPEAAFAAYERLRRPRAERVVAYGRRSGDQKRGGRLAGLLRTLLLPVFLRLAPPPRWLYDYRVRWA